MSQYVIDIDDKQIEEQISAILNRVLQDQLHNRYSSVGREISDAVKDLIYSHKEEIIQRCVDKASAEIVKKGIPKILEQYGGRKDD